MALVAFRLATFWPRHRQLRAGGDPHAERWDGHHAVSIDEEKTIPHLYAAGECTGLLGWRRNHGKLGVCITFGRIAGQNVAKETPWS